MNKRGVKMATIYQTVNVPIYSSKDVNSNVTTRRTIDISLVYNDIGIIGYLSHSGKQYPAESDIQVIGNGDPDYYAAIVNLNSFEGNYLQSNKSFLLLYVNLKQEYQESTSVNPSQSDLFENPVELNESYGIVTLSAYNNSLISSVRKNTATFVDDFNWTYTTAPFAIPVPNTTNIKTIDKDSVS